VKLAVAEKHIPEAYTIAPEPPGPVRSSPVVPFATTTPRASAAVVLLVLGLLGCSGGAALAPGQEKAHCYSNGTCNAGLSCFSNICVRYDAGTSTQDASSEAAPVDGSDAPQEVGSLDTGGPDVGVDGGVDAGDLRGGDDANDALTGPAGECGAAPSPGSSCTALLANCGQHANEPCCSSLCVPGGKFTLGRNPGDPDDQSCGPLMCWPEETPGIPATIRPYWLDRFEVTVARFRQFVAAAGWRPAPGSGQHGYLDGGEKGWDQTWPLPATVDAWNSALACDTSYTTWTPSAGANENKPMTCVSWYDAYAFCIWDGGFLPTDAEWELAASGGEERLFPWSMPVSSRTIDASYACYATGCSTTGPRPVGSTPAGDGRWGHADLAGNVAEWILDTYGNPLNYSGTCVDCVQVADSTERGGKSGPWDFDASGLRAVARHHSVPDARTTKWGFRCARAAQPTK
jgi:formylglycine-generating enzyme required for sulfatase activity